PVVLVGHTYGGAVITQAAAGHPNVKALVSIAAATPAAFSWLFPRGCFPAAVPAPFRGRGRTRQRGAGNCASNHGRTAVALVPRSPTAPLFG
ncbi:hypothetical protein ACWD5D_40485, partial [Streptomyces sp. NPDC002520]